MLKLLLSLLYAIKDKNTNDTINIKHKIPDIQFNQLKILRTNKLKSAIFVVVVEDNGEDCVGHHSKKDDDRQDPILWVIFL